MDYDRAARRHRGRGAVQQDDLGLEVLELGPGMARVLLPDDEGLLNHVGTQHASGMFAAAEAASGGAFLAGFAERMGEIRPLAAAAEIEYTKLAEGPIDGARGAR